MTGRALLLLALSLSAACRRAPTPMVEPPRPVLLAAQSDPPCPPIPLDDDQKTQGQVRAPAPEVSLASLLRPRPSKPPPRRSPRIDLGKIIHPDADPRPRENFDVSRLELPRELVTGDLPESLRGSWAELFGDRDKLFRARVKERVAAREHDRCKAAACALERCLALLTADLTARSEAAERAHQAQLSQFIEDLQTFVARVSGTPKAGATLALGYAAEERVRTGADLSGLEAPIALYGRAKETAKPGSEIDWWARYKLGSALADSGQTMRAAREYAALGALSAEPKLRAEASFRQGELDPEPGRAASAYQAAVSLSGSDPAARQIHWAAAYRFADIEITRRHFPAALESAAEAARAINQSGAEIGEPEVFFDLVTPLLAEALNALGAAELSTAPSVPASIVGPLGAAAADLSVARFDIAAAVRAWQAVLTYAPESLEAPRALTGLIAAHERAGEPEAAAPLRQRRERDYGPSSAWATRLRGAQAEMRPDDAQITKAVLAMPPPLPRIPVSDLDRERDLTGRVQALVTACSGSRAPDDPTELELRVDLEPRARIAALAPTGGGNISELAACLKTLGPAYFVDAPADLRATVRFEREGLH